MKVTTRQLKKIIREQIESILTDKRDELMDALKDKFGISIIRTTEEFGSSPGGIWLSAEHADEASDGMDLFDIYAGDQEPYEMGVHKELLDLIGSYGFFAEFYDSGTIMLWKT